MQSTATALESELLPSWFTPARFLDEHFNAEAYVADLRRFVSLEFSLVNGSDNRVLVLYVLFVMGSLYSTTSCLT